MSNVPSSRKLRFHYGAGKSILPFCSG
jgi:hypothetical protein